MIHGDIQLLQVTDVFEMIPTHFWDPLSYKRFSEAFRGLIIGSPETCRFIWVHNMDSYGFIGVILRDSTGR